MNKVDPNILSAQNSIGAVDQNAPMSTETILQNIDDTSFQQVDSAYANKEAAIDTALGSNAVSVASTGSIFNPLYMFRYAKYGSTNGDQYYPENHKDLSEISANTNRGPRAKTAENQYIVENPSATEIIRWAKNGASNNSEGVILGPTPYQLNDFLWCKWYGKIPNNRLLTLRRYAIPVEDNLQIASKKMPLVPIAQAVTWWGGESDNALGAILGINYGFNWVPRIAQVDDVAGNEVGADALLDAVGISKTENSAIRNILLATVFDNPNNAYESTGYDKKLQTWTQEAWGETGAYWNRVLGPVNVIHETTIRERGFKFTNDISLKFEYKLRSYQNINPKIAMLDLISNFLALTHNSADFWGGAIRYFQKTGYILPGLPTTLFEEGDYIGGVKDVVAYVAATIKTQLEETASLVKDIGNNINSGSAGGVEAALRGNSGAQNLAGSWVKNLMQVPLKMRSFLDGRAVGEWHLTVGNPMNPFATIGNLLVYDTTIRFSEEVGLDDTPTGVSFTVSLKHGRPRAKQDIESIFNLGGGSMYKSPLPPPSSAHNSQANKDQVLDEDKNIRIPKGERDAAATATGLTQYDDNINAKSTDKMRPATISEISNTVQEFGKRVKIAYGDSFGKSEILSDYFKDLKIKE